MKRTAFYILLVLIVFFGFLLRLVDYDRIPPFGETKDEFLYPWLGMSLIQTGTPTGWSLLSSYTEVKYVTYWGEQFRLASPWLEKPPLYSIFAGLTVLAKGENEFQQVRLSTVRILPILLSIVAIVLVGLIAMQRNHPIQGIIAASMYATTPLFVMGNRMSVTENLLIPLLLGAILLLSKVDADKKLRATHLSILSVLTFLVLLTKQTGLALPLMVGAYSLTKKDWRTLITIAIVTLAAFSINPLMGWYFDWTFYQAMQKDLFAAVNLGFPETFSNFFRFLGVGHKESLFLDGTYLAGLLLIFNSPFQHFENKTIQTIFLLPLAYLLILTLTLSGATWYGWYMFPLYPFCALILAHYFYHVWLNPDFKKFLFFFMFIGASSLRFLLLTTKVEFSWQPLLLSLFILSAVIWSFGKQKVTRTFLAALFIVYLGINVFTILNLDQLYPSRTQPLNPTTQRQ